jgi:hypothetical protein
MVTGQTIHPLNHSTIFLKTKDIIMTNDVWRIVLDLNLRPYENLISTLRGDLQLVHNGTTEFTVEKELEQVEILLEGLETKLSSLGQFTPKLDPRRGLLNIGGMFLKTLFGTATVTDLNSLQDTLEIYSHIRTT